jgi:catechol 2,3-dioxygenase-like lactoylglutathione lyase family enzyme
MNLNQVTVPCTNLSRSIAFYETLGLKLIVEAQPRYARFLCPEGDATFSLHLSDTPIQAGVVVYFECENLDERVSELKAKGIVFTMDPVDQTWLWREAHLPDPDGNQLILFFAGKNRKDPPWRLESSKV